MPKKKAKDEGDPDWVMEDIQNAKYQKPEKVKRIGYILELNGDQTADVQLYDPVEDGRHIITMNLSKKIKVDDLERGVVYELVFEQRKAPLSKKTLEYVKSKWSLEMDALYEFELKTVKQVDEDRGNSDDSDSEPDEE